MCFHVSYISRRDMNAKQSRKGKIAIRQEEQQRAELSQLMGTIHIAWMILTLSLCAILLNLAWLIVSFASRMLGFFTFSRLFLLLGCYFFQPTYSCVFRYRSLKAIYMSFYLTSLPAPCFTGLCDLDGLWRLAKNPKSGSSHWPQVRLSC